MNSFTVWESLWHRISRVQAGLDTLEEFFLLLTDHAFFRILGKNPRRQLKKVTERLLRSIKKEADCYVIGEVKLPLLDTVTEQQFFGHVFEDVFYSYLHCEDCYEEKIMDKYYYLLDEGPCCLKNDCVDVQVRRDDIVIDAGSWIGDFAAYASRRGATVYAFEPVNSTYEYLLKTSKLNPNIVPVKKGLGNAERQATISNDTNYSLGNALTDIKTGGERIEITTIDTFVRSNNLSRIDFIKSDIEGYERHMLEGAQKTLAQFSPKLSLCTYHLPDDPEVLASLIRQANSEYHIVQKRKKLYASVAGEFLCL